MRKNIFILKDGVWCSSRLGVPFTKSISKSINKSSKQARKKTEEERKVSNGVCIFFNLDWSVLGTVCICMYIYVHV